jgi:hypothetical protein
MKTRNRRSRLMIALACLGFASAACTPRIVVDERDRQSTIVSVQKPKTSGKGKHGLRLVVRDVRTGFQDHVSLQRGACPRWKETAFEGRVLTVRYVSTRAEDSAEIRPEATNAGLKSLLC